MDETSASDADEDRKFVPQFLRPVVRFGDSMTSARRAIDLMTEHGLKPSDVEDEFVAEAHLMWPQLDVDHNRRAARMIHKSVHRFMDLEVDGDSDDYAQAYGEIFQSLEADLIKMTGNENAELYYRTTWNRITTRPSLERVLGSSLLMRIVSDFEVLVAGLVRAILAQRPEILRASDRSYSFRELDQFESLQEFREAVAEEIADGLLRGGFKDWMAWFGTKLHVEVPGVVDAGPEFLEVFQRRHLFVHNAGVVNSAYLRNTRGMDSQPKEGEELTVTHEYLARAADLLEAAGVKLGVATTLKFAPRESTRRTVEGQIENLTYQTLRRARYSVVEDVLDWYLPKVEDEVTRLSMRVNLWVSRKHRLGLESVRSEINEWDTRALDSRYRLVKFALLDQNDEAVNLAVELYRRGSLDAASWATWPVLAGVRVRARELQAELPIEAGWRTHRHS